MIQDLSSRISKKKLIHQILPFGIISVIGIFGIITTSMLITLNVNSTHLATQAFLTENLPAISGADEESDNRVYIIGRPTYIWILKYVFDEGNNDFQSYYNKGKIYSSISEGNADKFVFIVDGKFKTDLKKSTTKEDMQAIQELYDNSTSLSKINVKNTNKFDSDQYPYSTNTNVGGKGGGRVEIRASNYMTDGSNNNQTISRDEALKRGVTGDILTDLKLIP
jgi:hypothetical protein